MARLLVQKTCEYYSIRVLRVSYTECQAHVGPTRIEI